MYYIFPASMSSIHKTKLCIKLYIILYTHVHPCTIVIHAYTDQIQLVIVAVPVTVILMAIALVLGFVIIFILVVRKLKKSKRAVKEQLASHVSTSHNESYGNVGAYETVVYEEISSMY